MLMKKTISKFIKFLFFGSLTYWINIWLTYFLTKELWIKKEFSYFISIFFISIINFVSSLKLTFKTNYSHKTLVKYIIFLTIFSLFNYLFTIFFTNIFWQTYLYIIIFIITTFFFLLKYIIYDKYVFKSKFWI